MNDNKGRIDMNRPDPRKDVPLAELVKRYLLEVENPVPDLVLRSLYRDQLAQAVLGRKMIYPERAPLERKVLKNQAKEPDRIARLEQRFASLEELFLELRRLLEAIRSEITPSPATRLARAGIRAIDARDPSINHGGTEMSDPQSHQPAAEGHHPESQSHQPPAQSQEAAPDPAAEAPDFAEIRAMAERVLAVDVELPKNWRAGKIDRSDDLIHCDGHVRPIVRVNYLEEDGSVMHFPMLPRAEGIADLRNHAPTLARAVLDLRARVAELEVERDAAISVRDEALRRQVVANHDCDAARKERNDAESGLASATDVVNSMCRELGLPQATGYMGLALRDHIRDHVWGWVDRRERTAKADADRDAALQRAEQLERELDDLRRTIELHTQSNQIGPMWEQIQSLRAARDAALQRALAAEDEASELRAACHIFSGHFNWFRR